ncbi:GNAT family N-acetyltransferase [Niabella ginsengisoli]|uniref:GNAT family N-acetyltransferase n=1 Tax=Niabella ginsengisoli TaxID=522298 RepID=A0ABS9SH48_9BACT|nr:GNAT family protein [Niabella ginsengisoli]MCH5597689.1 GNAT family N-acetyltransferase [Niabella ginsengisoli]
MLPKNLILETNKVLLRVMDEKDFEAFHKLTVQDKGMWEFFSLNLSDENQLNEWMEDAFASNIKNSRIPFTIIDKSSDEIAGSSSIGNIAWHDKRLEIGWSWLAPKFRGTEVNRHAKYVMMRYAFEQMNFERVEFKTGVLNIRARKGLEKIGGIEEGTLRSHSLLWNGVRRTSVFYSVLKDEWPKLKSTIFADIG